MELDALAREREWLLKSEVPLTINQLTLCLERAMSLFKSNAKKGNGKEDVSQCPGKYVFSSPHQDAIKAVVALDGHRITHADLSLRLPSAKSNAPPMTTALKENASWPLHQLQTSKQCVARALHLLQDTPAFMNSGHCLSSAANQLMQQLEVLLSKATDSLMIPDQWDLSEQARLNYQGGLRHQLPDDTMVVFYIHCSRLVVAMYTVTAAPTGVRFQGNSSVRSYVGSIFERHRHLMEVSTVNRIEVTLAWVSEVLCLLTTARQLCQELKEKVTLTR